MFVIIYSHKSAHWSKCVGPFDTYLDAHNYQREHLYQDYFRTAIHQPESPNEA